MTLELRFDPGKDRKIKQDENRKREKPKTDEKNSSPRSKTKELGDKIEVNDQGQGHWESAR